MKIGLAIFCFACGLVEPVFGQAIVSLSPSDVVRLNPDQREAAIEAGAMRAGRELPINGLSRGVHGEIGTEFGSHGERAFYGAASLPLGQTGSASFSFSDERLGNWRRR